MLYWPCTEEWVLDVIKNLVSKYHTDIAQAKIGVIWKEKASGDETNKKLATMSKVSEKQKASGVDYNFVMEIASDTWNDLTPEQRVSLIDHELCHAGCEEDETTSEKKYTIIKHDLEEFRSVVERHGFWRDSVTKFAETMKNVKE